MSMSADGKIATVNGKVGAFGSRRDHEHLLELRSTVDCVIAGAATLNSGAINLGPGNRRYRKRRLERGLEEYNLRVVVSGSGGVSPDAEIFRHRFSPIIVLTTGRISGSRLRVLSSLSETVRVCGETEIDFRSAFGWLRSEWGVKRLLCEGGGELNDAVLRSGLVDEIHLTICPLLIGGAASPTIAGGTGAGPLALAHRFQPVRMKKRGAEMFATFRRVR